MPLELSSDKAVECISKQTKEIMQSKYFKAVHKGHTTRVVLWDKSGLNFGDPTHRFANKNGLFNTPELHLDVGESDEKSEFEVILENGTCDTVHHWKIDRILREKYPEIAAKVDKDIEEKLAKSSNDQRKSLEETKNTDSQSETEKPNGSSSR